MIITFLSLVGVPPIEGGACPRNEGNHYHSFSGLALVFLGRRGNGVNQNMRAPRWKCAFNVIVLQLDMAHGLASSKSQTSMAPPAKKVEKGIKIWAWLFWVKLHVWALLTGLKGPGWWVPLNAKMGLN